MRPKVIAGNWKMYHGPAAARRFFGEFSPRLPDAEPTILIFPPAISLPVAAESRGGRPEISLGIQNIHWEPKGAFTGEHSAAMALAAGAGSLSWGTRSGGTCSVRRTLKSSARWPPQ